MTDHDISDLETVLAGRCVHGHGTIDRCGTCQLTIYLAAALRAIFDGLSGGRADR